MQHPRALTRQQSREVDQLAIEHYGMSGLVLMENAGRGCADLLQHRGVNGPVAVLCGKGNNGGDGFVIARHLWIRNCDVRVLLAVDPQQLAGDAAANFAILEQAGASIVYLAEEGDACGMPGALNRAAGDSDWLVDCLLGTGAVGSPRPPYDTIIEWMNVADAKRLAVDTPSGLDCDTGQPATNTVRADLTATFVTTKVGFEQPAAQPYLGEIKVLDIGIPPGLLQQIASS